MIKESVHTHIFICLILLVYSPVYPGYVCKQKFLKCNVWHPDLKVAAQTILGEKGIFTQSYSIIPGGNGYTVLNIL